MASGVGGLSFLSNLPPDQFAVMPAVFNQATERQDIPLPSQSFNGFGSETEIRLPQVGVASLVQVYASLSLHTNTFTAGSLTLLPGWPYSLAWKASLNANGQTSIIKARGTVLRARRLRMFRNPPDIVQAGPTPGTLSSNTAYSIAFLLDIPISHDMFSGVGWILAQNPQTYLTVNLAWANEANVIAKTGEAAVSSFTGTISSELTTFAVGQANVGGQTKTIVPDLSVLHGILDNTYPITGTGVVQAPLIRTAGQLMYYAFNVNNGGVSEIAPLSLTEASVRYGGNRQPRVYKPTVWLVEKNQRDYNGVLSVANLTFSVFDFEVDNPVRDLVIPEGLVELESQIEIPGTVTVNAGAYLHYVQESLYPVA